MALPDITADEAVAAKGWAEFHPLARTDDLPGSVVMVYAPRDRDELEVVWSLVRSSYAFASSSTEHR